MLLGRKRLPRRRKSLRASAENACVPARDAAMLSRRHVETSLVALFLLECLVILAIAGQNEFSPLSSSSAQILLLASVTLVSVAIRLLLVKNALPLRPVTSTGEPVVPSTPHLVLHQIRIPIIHST